ncbi:PREDICTED: protein trunk-like [Nicrophorus vespilloides]|uniref:Protein trunk-like n=1 Tax=Nicrophorus vespilloides TaxID=110193 RepID=A0ABM1MM68_NICVS|nr:PREDICTED: protein trunk-like [Nicrophorus vespilloides]
MPDPVAFLTLMAMASVVSSVEQNCKEMPKEILGKILGPAFNARYMSIEAPEILIKNNEGDRRRKTVFDPSFYVDSDFEQELSDEPAWNVDHIEVNLRRGHLAKGRTRREGPEALAWHCKSKVHWSDLGIDYFPRYMRSVECLKDKCWYNRFECQPRSFTVKVLRRKPGNCTLIPPGVRVGTIGLPTDLRELWVWEERALNFCCDCISNFKQLISND